MIQYLLFIIAPIAVVVLNVGRWARAAAEGNWGGPLGELLLFGLLLYALFKRRRVTGRQSGDTGRLVVALVILGPLLSASGGLATAQPGSDLKSDEATCRQPSGGGSSIAACDKLVSSKRFEGHALAVILNDRGLLRYRNGDAQSALADYDAAIAADQGLGTAYYNRGLALTQLGRLEQAIDSFGEAGKRVPDRAVIWHSRGAARMMTGDVAAALPDFDRALTLDPKMALAWGYRGVAHVRLGEIEKGIADLKESLRLDPQNSTIAAALEEAEAAHAGR